MINLYDMYIIFIIGSNLLLDRKLGNKYRLDYFVIYF